MEIAGEVQIDLVHRRDLRLSTAGRPAFDPEARPQTRFAQRNHRALADCVQRIAESDGSGGFAFPRRCWADPGDQHQRAVRFVIQAAQKIEIDLGLVAPVRDQRGVRYPSLGRNRGNRLQGRGAGDFDISGHVRTSC